MKFLKIFTLSLILSINNLSAFKFTSDPIDAVIPCHKKDIITLDLVINGIRTNVRNIRRIIVVSEQKLTDKAEWCDERDFPFSRQSIADEIFKGEPERARAFAQSPESRVGWILQQFLKVYSIFVIPNISTNVLIVDADTIFLRPVKFQDPATNAGLYNPGSEYHLPYFKHLERVLPDFKRVFEEYSGISHHMLFQKSVMDELFSQIKKIHNEEPWKVFCHQADQGQVPWCCMCVEYELYFNFVFARSKAVKIRPLKWANIPLRDFEWHKNSKAYDYLSCHSYLK